MIVYGGQHVGPLGDIWSFDLSGNAWSDLTPSSRPSGRFFATSICAAGRVFVFGGMTASGNSGDVWAFSAADSSWGLVPVSGPLPGPRNSHAAIFVPLEDAMIVFGGTGDTATNDIWMLSGLVSGVRRPFASPAGFGLGQNYPNPFNPSTAIPFRLDEYGPVSLKVFDILGREVEALVEETLAPGRHVRSWDGGAAASGVYMVRLSTPRWRQNRPIVLLR